MSANLSPAKQLLLFGSEEARRQAKTPKELQLLDAAQAALTDDGSAISFLHKGFCHCGLPLRKRDNTATWTRTDGQFSFTVAGSTVSVAGQEQFIGLPYGPKARLLSVYLASEVKNPRRRADDRTIQFGKISEWLKDAGVLVTGGERGSIQATKEQLVRLAFAIFTMTLARAGQGTWFHREGLIESGCLADGDLEAFGRGEYGKLSWPDHVTLTRNAHERMMTQAIPIATQRLQAIAHNAAAIDFFVWLSYRLPRIPAGDDVLASWTALTKQFGDSSYVSHFKQNYLGSLELALSAYPEANVEITDEGLILRHSDPSVPRRTLVAVSGGKSLSRLGAAVE
ncbi:MAG: replication protein RepA [Rhodospirillaceae bacterium]